MKLFIYKTLFAFVCFFLLFQLTIGLKIKQLNNELERLKSKENIEVIKNKLREFEGEILQKPPKASAIKIAG